MKTNAVLTFYPFTLLPPGLLENKGISQSIVVNAERSPPRGKGVKGGGMPDLERLIDFLTQAH
jgi:hypothetical protein